jgi:hypothetical protein
MNGLAVWRMQARFMKAVKHDRLFVISITQAFVENQLFYKEIFAKFAVHLMA